MTIFTVLIVVIFIFTMIGLIIINSTASKTTKKITETSNKMIKLSEINDLKEEEKELRKLIKIKHQELENLVHATEQAKRRTVTNLTVEQEEAIDLYEKNGIRLPIDIVEELSYSNCVTYHSAVSFIEMQRKIWKAQFSVTMTKGMI